jgi:RsiW-degrading membrane proteinase PrsW (M82 family)
MFPPYPATLVIQGTNWRAPRAFGSQAPLFKPQIYIGKLASNDIILSDSYASRVHAAIYWTPSGYEIEDLRSTNGVFVNGARITGRTPLSPGQVIRIGHTDMTFFALQGAPWPGARSDGASQSVASVAPPPALPAYAPAYPAAPGAYAGATAVPAPFHHPGVAPSRGSRFGAWLRAEARKRYWKVFLVGLVLLIISEILLSFNVSGSLILVVPIASALMPVTFVVYCWDSDYLADMPRWIPWVVFSTSAVLGVTLALILETRFVNNELLSGSLLVGLIEESCKALAVVWVLFNRKLRSEIDGVILGAAAGAGFATLETMGYALAAYSGDLGPGNGVVALNFTLLLRGLLAIFGHVTWTAIVVGAIWRDRGQSHFKLTFGVVFAFLMAVTLHGIWDGLGYLGVIIAAIIGFWLLRFFLREAVARERLGAYAPSPPPLLAALGTYLLHPFRDPLHQAPAPAPAMFSGSWSVQPVPVWAPPPPQQPVYQAPAVAQPAYPPVVAPPYPPAAGAPPMRICANGHSTTDPSAKFCRVCGAPLGA